MFRNRAVKGKAVYAPKLADLRGNGTPLEYSEFICAWRQSSAHNVQRCVRSRFSGSMMTLRRELVYIAGIQKVRQDAANKVLAALVMVCVGKNKHAGLLYKRCFYCFSVFGKKNI